MEQLRQLEPAIEARVVDCTDEESLREAGILDMGTVVVAIGEPIEASITATLIAKDSEGTKVKQVIARATSDLHEKMLKRVGADRVIFPSRMQGERLGLELVRPNLMERLALDETHGIEEIKVPEPFVGQSLRDLNLRKNYRVECAGCRAPAQSHRQSTSLPCARTGAPACCDGTDGRPATPAENLTPCSVLG